MRKPERFFKIQIPKGKPFFVASEKCLFTEAKKGSFAATRCTKTGETLKLKKAKKGEIFGEFTEKVEVFLGKTVGGWIKEEMFFSLNFGELVTKAEFIEELEARIACEFTTESTREFCKSEIKIALLG